MIHLVETASTWSTHWALDLTRLDLRGTANLGSGTDLVYPSGRVPTASFETLLDLV